MTDDVTPLADITQRLIDLERTNCHPRWTVVSSPGGPVPFYALYQRRYWAVVVAAITEKEAVAYLTAKPKVTEDPLTPGNVLECVYGTAVDCLKAGASYMAVPARRHVAPYPVDFDRADVKLRDFVAQVVTAVSPA